MLNASVHPPPTYEPSSANPRLFPLSLPRPNYHSSGLDEVHALKMLPITFRPEGGRVTQELWFEKCIGNFEFIETKQGWPTLSPTLSEVLQE